MFGTGEKFDLTHAVYAREGSAFFLIENYYSHLLQLSSYKPGAWLNANPFLFDLRVFHGATELPYTYHGDPGSIRLTCAKGRLELIFTYHEYARILSGDGLSLMLEASRYKPGMPAVDGSCHGVCTLPDGTTELSCSTFGKLRLRPLKGSVKVETAQSDKGEYTAVRLILLPDEAGELDFALHEDMIEIPALPASYPDPETLRQDGFDRYESFLKNYRKPAAGFE